MILAGGLGTRMRPYTESFPKALIPVLGRPFTDWQLEWLRDQGVTRVVYSIGYRGDAVQRHVGSGQEFGLHVTYVDEGANLRGTGGALRLAADLDQLPAAFFLLYGDSYLQVDLAEVEGAWRRAALPALMTVFRNDGRWDASNAIYENGRVTVYDKRPASRRPAMRWIDYGLSILRRSDVEQGVEEERPADVAELLQDLSSRRALAGYEVTDRFYEVGSPAGLRALESHLASIR
ncbi:MAG: sugar phosphate nucleotidyltransferase [Candidatus Dormiibacterota bacterium]